MKTTMEPSSYSKSLLFIYKLCIAILILGQIGCTNVEDVGSCHANEAAALLTWKSSMENDSRVILSSWISENRLCNNWSGIICNEGGRVSNLNLSDFGIRGTFHDLDVSCFNEIMSIDVSYNYLYGVVPPKISNLSTLTYLNLGFNNFSGNIPPQIGLLSNLRLLNMHRNILTGSIPKGVGRLRSLYHLDLGSNDLSGSIPDSFSSFNNLEIMDLSCNYLSGKIPIRLGLLQSVENLNLSHNNLSGPVPSSFQYCFSLKSIDISFNQLKGPLPNIPAFRNPHSSFVSNNSGLCGDIMGLKPCYSDTLIGGSSGKNNITKILILGFMIGMIVAATVFLVCFLLIRNVSYDKEIDDFTIPSPDSRPLIGCEEILEATEGFSTKYRIAVGRSGNLYKSQFQDGTVVAVKKFNATKNGWGDEGWRRKSLISEAQILYNDLRHRNIVKSYGLCIRHENCRYLILELLQTRSLSKILRDDKHAQNFGWSARIQVLQCVADALVYMHHYYSPPMVHRKVESKNILFDFDNVARLCGFGKASRVIDSKCVSDDIFKIDVYSFGKLILEVLMGKPSGDFISMVSSSTASSSLIPLKDFIDHRALPPTYVEQGKIFCASWLAFLCVDPNPHLRPTMHQVSSNLAHLRPKENFVLSTVTISQLIDRNFFDPSRDGLDAYASERYNRVLVKCERYWRLLGSEGYFFGRGSSSSSLSSA